MAFPKPASAELFEFTIEQSPSALTSELDIECRSQFGPAYRVADWIDVVDFVERNGLAAFYSDSGLSNVGDDGWLSRDGLLSPEPGAYYIIERHDGILPVDFLIEETIASHSLDLGVDIGLSTWSNPRRILCFADCDACTGLDCPAICFAPECGNFVVDSGENCDDGNIASGDGCDSHCQPECGNQRDDPGEQCDDGNRIDGDGCTSTCTLEICGSLPCPPVPRVTGTITSLDSEQNRWRVTYHAAGRLLGFVGYGFSIRIPSDSRYSSFSVPPAQTGLVTYLRVPDSNLPAHGALEVVVTSEIPTETADASLDFNWSVPGLQPPIPNRLTAYTSEAVPSLPSVITTPEPTSTVLGATALLCLIAVRRFATRNRERREASPDQTRSAGVALNV